MKFLWERKPLLALLIALLVAGGVTIFALITPGGASVTAEFLGRTLRPFNEGLSFVSEKIRYSLTNREEIDALLLENQRLRERLAEIETDSREYARAIEENSRLRELLGFAQRRRDLTLMPASVTARDTDNYARTLTLSRGSAAGVTFGMTAVNESGQLVGRVSEVGSSWCTLRVLTDADFRAAAYVYGGDTQAPLAGRFDLMSKRLSALTGVGLSAPLPANGSQVFTSGAGGGVPRDIEIGTIVGAEYDAGGLTATLLVKPSAELGGLTQVFLVTGVSEEE